MVTMGAPMIRKNTRGLLPAPEKIFDVAVQALMSISRRQCESKAADWLNLRDALPRT